MFDSIAGLRFTLEADGFDRFETVCGHEESESREILLQKEGIEEAYVLRTCQRYELFAAGPQAAAALLDLATKIGLEDAPDRTDLESGTFEPPIETDHLLIGRPAIDHLLRVAAGLESGVLGEDEILGQLRRAYRRASEAEALGGPLDTIVLKALRVGERARTETAINEGTVSLGSVTLDRIAEECAAEDPIDGLEDCETIVVGAGEVAELVIEAIERRLGTEGSILVANRTPENAQPLAERVGAEAIALEALDEDRLESADVLVSATGADDRVFGIGDLVGHELVAVDLANPRDIDPAVGDLEEIRHVSIDEVLSVRNDELERREAAIPAVEAIVDEEIDRLAEQLRMERIDGTLERIYSRAHSVRAEEFDRAIDRLEGEGESLSEAQEAAMRDFSEALINKLLHPKTTALKQAAATNDRETLDAWLQLAELESGDRDPEAIVAEGGHGAIDDEASTDTEAR